MIKDIILVDKNNKEIGEGEKMKVHKQGQLHRAFSIFVFNNKNQLMLQKRATEKYHSPNLWSNTCCSHPMPGEKTLDGACRRLKEEMGFSCNLKELFCFRYKIEFANNLIENECDHVFIGKYSNAPTLNMKEASSWKWIDLPVLKNNIDKNPNNYTHWLKACLNKVISGI